MDNRIRALLWAVVISSGTPAALADPITVEISGSQVRASVEVTAGGVTVQDEQVLSGDATVRANATLLDASAASYASQSLVLAPHRISGIGVASAETQTLTSLATSAAQAGIGLFLFLTTPHSFTLDARFSSSQTAMLEDFLSQWSLIFYKPDGGVDIFRANGGRGDGETRIVRSGVLQEGLYQFIVDASATAISTVGSSSSYDFNLSFSDVSATPGPVPEPGTMLLFGTGFALMAKLRRRART